jgi:hypothetical protein
MSEFKYIFTHRSTKARLICVAENPQKAIIILGKLCQTVMDWDMRTYKYRPGKKVRKKIKKLKDNGRESN